MSDTPLTMMQRSLAQLVDLHERLQSAGVPRHLLPQVLRSGLPMGLSIWVSSGGAEGNIKGKVQVVTMALSEARFGQV